MFFMLTLVLAANYVLLFVGWEGVGLVQLPADRFLLPEEVRDRRRQEGVHRKPHRRFRLHAGACSCCSAHSARWISRRCSRRLGRMPAEAMGQFGTLTVACMLLFVGATGKSAQLPLYVWLPDAMEGPTPVSALIHAATMVTAGVYVVARSHVLFLHAPTAMYVVAIIGCATAFFAATIGLVQPTSRKFWHIRLSASSATCSWDAASARSARAFSI